MVSMMVRKATPRPDHPAHAREAGQGRLPPEEVVAEATEGLQEMDGIEVDTDSVRTSRSSARSRHGEGEPRRRPANLVKRWLSCA